MSGRITINLNAVARPPLGFDAYVDKLQAIEQAGLDGVVCRTTLSARTQYPWGGW